MSFRRSSFYRRSLLLAFAFVAVAVGGSARAYAAPLPSRIYLKDIGLSTVPQLTLQAKSAVTTVGRLRVFVDYSQYRGGWVPRTRAYIGDIESPVSGQSVQLRLANSARMPNGGENDLWWGSPLASHPVSEFELNPLVPAALVRARISIVGPSGAEQHHYFLLVRSPEIGGRVGVIPANDADGWIDSWEEGRAN
jgi:hypothetical protein